MTTLSLPIGFLLGDQTPMELFHNGGPIMWPILLVSFVMITVVIERILFMIRENASREPEVVQKMLEHVENRDVEGALAIGRKSKDFIARILVYSLSHREHSLSNAFIRASSQELNRYSQGLATLDTVITAAPLLGLLGTVTGMMRTFGSMTGDLSSAAGQITGGVAEALIATACGLTIAILALFPYNIMNSQIENAKHNIADASNALEILLKKSETEVR
ncbi:MotA/TolQ/ExbB proton channel family protein [Horticoccus luteus]|uniref:MotA/TolQ/ExbB proton channel family protein n=1 Tax=Horticoccus luteus TaxID=2862869 RepID=A0A8F9XJC4_9BACT|nr:MotA/TolQ/ExbB proton channel family protein [Horticoccus luteus]QYM78518.1 MotA/TolQ/ExbB proton channel family protein [Horticoccus luteus]